VRRARRRPRHLHRQQPDPARGRANHIVKSIRHEPTYEWIIAGLIDGSILGVVMGDPCSTFSLAREPPTYEAGPPRLR
jgi:hypothetical protein